MTDATPAPAARTPEPLLAACPVCAAPAGSPCVNTEDGLPRFAPHSRRYQAAPAETPPAAEPPCPTCSGKKLVCTSIGACPTCQPTPAVPPTDGTTAPATLQQVSEWSNRALMFMATYAYGFAELDPAVDAVHKLAQLARRALGPQGEADMTWNVRNDPPCAAAFALGRSEMAEALTAERAAQEQAEALLRECESAILAAIVDEDGLDAKRGWALCDRIRATLAVPPEAPCD